MNISKEKQLQYFNDPDCKIIYAYKSAPVLGDKPKICGVFIFKEDESLDIFVEDPVDEIKIALKLQEL